jgi:type II secretory pathway pseudopilin PulG
VPFLNSKRGFTLVEATAVTGLMVLVVLSVVSMMIGAMRTYDSSSNRTYTDQDAVMAMQMMVSEIREAKSITPLDPGPDSGTRLRVVLPELAEDEEYYDRHKADTANCIDYYVSDSSGEIGETGTWLWRAQSGTTRVLKTDVESVLFERDTSRSVKITVISENDAPSGTKRTELTQRVVYLRNY